MGSLMPGWSTKPVGAKDAVKRSNSSLTKEEVERFWRTKRSSIQEHLDEANRDAAVSPRGRSIPVPNAGVAGQGILAQEPPASPSDPAFSPRSDWWTKSNWAFLNEPPTTEEKQHRYTPQFDVATKAHMAVNQTNRTLSAF